MSQIILPLMKATATYNPETPKALDPLIQEITALLTREEERWRETEVARDLSGQGAKTNPVDEEVINHIYAAKMALITARALFGV